MPGGLAANDPARFSQRFKNVTVADAGAAKLDLGRDQCMLEPEIAHYRSHYRTFEAAILLP